MKICVLSDETFGDYTPAYYLKDYRCNGKSRMGAKEKIKDESGDLKTSLPVS
jgi:hypothetical protein